MPTEPYRVTARLQAFTPGGTLVRGPGPIGEPFLEQALTMTYDTLTISGGGAAAQIAGLMLLGPNDFDGPDLRLSASFYCDGFPSGPITVTSISCFAAVHAYLLIPATVYQEETGP